VVDIRKRISRLQNKRKPTKKKKKKKKKKQKQKKRNKKKVERKRKNQQLKARRFQRNKNKPIQTSQQAQQHNQPTKKEMLNLLRLIEPLRLNLHFMGQYFAITKVVRLLTIHLISNHTRTNVLFQRN